MTLGLQSAEKSMLGTKFARSVRDNVLAECAIQVMRLGGMVILARALSAAEFGLFKVLMAISLLAMLLIEAGLTEALVQRKDIRAEHESTACWTSLVLALFGSIVLYRCAPLIGRLMAMPMLPAGLRLMCVPIFLDCIAVTSNARLQRELRFGRLAVAEVIAEVGFLAVALTLLWTRLAQWSLVAGLATRFAARAVTVLVAQPCLPTTWPRIWALRDLRRFAAAVWGGSIINIISANADFLLIGRLLGESALGFYSLAWDLLRFIPDRLYKVAGRVTFPAFCQLQHDEQELAQAYLDFFHYVARIVLPVVACAALAAPELIGVVYGSRWLPAATLLRVLAFGLGLVGLRAGIGSVYYAKDHPSFDIFLHSIRLILIVVVVGKLAGSGLVYTTEGMSGVEAVISVVGMLLACSLIGLKLRHLAVAAIPGLRLAAACLFATAVGKAFALFGEMQGPLVLALVAFPPAAVFCCLEASTMRAMLASVFTPPGKQAAEIF